MTKSTIRTNLQMSHALTGSWNETAKLFNARFGINLSKASYQAWAVNGTEPADEKTRQAFGLKSRKCPTCHRTIASLHRNRSYNAGMTPAQKYWRGLPKSEREKIYQAVYEQLSNKKGN